MRTLRTSNSVNRGRFSLLRGDYEICDGAITALSAAMFLFEDGDIIIVHPEDEHLAQEAME